MAGKKIFLIAGIGVLTYLLFKKSSGRIKNSKPGVLKKFGEQVLHSVTKSLDEIAEDIPGTPKIVNQDW